MANKIERITMVKAMEFIARNLNDEDVLLAWLQEGVADGDITYGCVAPTFSDESDLDYYIEDEHFADLMSLFLHLMKQACKSGGLYCDGILDKRNK